MKVQMVTVKEEAAPAVAERKRVISLRAKPLWAVRRFAYLDYLLGRRYLRCGATDNTAWLKLKNSLLYIEAPQYTGYIHSADLAKYFGGVFAERINGDVYNRAGVKVGQLVFKG